MLLRFLNNVYFEMSVIALGLRTVWSNNVKIGAHALSKDEIMD